MVFCRRMSAYSLRQLTWTDVDSLDKHRVIALLPVGAIEAHGPHLPLATDVVISESMAAAAAQQLEAHSLLPLVLPSLEYTAAPFAEAFPGTVAVRPETAVALIQDIAACLARWQIPLLGIANSHLDPTHLACLHQATDQIRAAGDIRVAYPDLTRRPWGSRLTAEFKSGACHAGQFEGSIVMHARPEWVQEETRRQLAPNPVSLAEAIASGKKSFEEAGGGQAYFGDPAAATSEEGRQTIEILGDILAEAVLSELGDKMRTS